MQCCGDGGHDVYQSCYAICEGLAGASLRADQWSARGWSHGVMSGELRSSEILESCVDGELRSPEHTRHRQGRSEQWASQEAVVGDLWYVNSAV